MRTARVSNPVGRSSSVAGSSFIVVRKTSTPPASRPFHISGSVMRRNVVARSSPRPRDGILEIGVHLEQRGFACARGLGQEERP